MDGETETCRVLLQNKINLRYFASGWFYYRKLNVQLNEKVAGLTKPDETQINIGLLCTATESDDLCFLNMLLLIKLLYYVL